MIKKLLIIFSMLALFVGCGVDEFKTITQRVTGKAVDGYVKNADVIIKNKRTGQIIAQAQTNDLGEFSFDKPDGTDVTIEVSGGVDTSTDKNFVGNMQTVISKDDNKTSFVITPVHSLVSQLVQKGVSIKDAKQIVANSLEIDEKSFESDPIELLKSGTNSQKQDSAKMMKHILKLQKFAEIIASVGNNTNKSYSGVFDAISTKLDENRSLKLTSTLDENGSNEIIDKLKDKNDNQIEKEKLESVKGISKNALLVINKLDEAQLQNTSSANIDDRIKKNSKAVELFLSPLKKKLKLLQQKNNSADINTTRQDALKVTQTAISMGGIKGITTILESEDDSKDIDTLSDEILTQTKIDDESAQYQNDIDAGKTSDEILNENEDSNTSTNTDNNTTSGTDNNTTTNTDNNTTSTDGNITSGTCFPNTIADDSSFSDTFPSDNINWSVSGNTVLDIQKAFNDARAVDTTISEQLVMPSQSAWDAMDNQQKALFLLNSERYNRGLKPFEGISSDVVTTAQNYANLLYTNGKFGHTEDGSPWERLDRVNAINNNKDFLGFAENIYAAAVSNDYTQEPIAKAIYIWIYADKTSWGHRKFVLAKFNDNSGVNGHEGLIGFGVKEGDSYAVYPNFKSTIIVLNAFDPSSTWDHTNTIKQINCNSSSDTNTDNNSTSGSDNNSTNSDNNTTSGTDNNTSTNTDNNSTSGSDNNTTSGGDNNTSTNTDNNSTTSTSINVDTNSTRANAIKFLKQASLSVKEVDITYVMNNGYEAWVDNQFNISFTNNNKLLNTMYGTLSNFDNKYASSMSNPTSANCEKNATPEKYRLLSQSLWWQRAFKGDDQLRQKVAYALSQIIVVSANSPAGSLLKWRGESLAYYYDILQKNAFSNYKTLLEDITYSPTMAYYMTYIGSTKYDATNGTSPDENYARELMQLFTIGINELDDNGNIVKVNGKDKPTYTQNDVVQNSKIFTGWEEQNSNKYGRITKKSGCYMLPIIFDEQYHDKSAKTVLGQTIPANQSGTQDIASLLNILMANNNIAPYISTKLIQRLTTSNPSAQYIKRVVDVFNDNGNGIKGDLQAVVKAILLDTEARNNTNNNSGKVDELLTSMTHLLSTFNIKPTHSWKFYNHKITSDKPLYWISSDSVFNQAPFSAPDVFNFYDASYAPNDVNFSTNNLVAPELQIQTSRNLIRYSEILQGILTYDKYARLNIEKDYTNMDDFMSNQLKNKSHAATTLVYVDLTDVYNAFEQALDGNKNNDFVNLNNHPDELNTGLNALVDYLNNKMLGGTLPNDYKTELVTELKTISGYDGRLPFRARQIVVAAIRSIATSPYYMVIR